MKNKMELKKCLVKIAAVILVFAVFVALLHSLEWRMAKQAYNQLLDQILQKVKKSYPDVSEEELIQILNGHGETIGEKESILEKYGISAEGDAALQAQEKEERTFLLVWIGVAILFGFCLSGVYLGYNRKKDRQLQEITDYLEKINQRNYSLEIESMTEDELSMLKTEIYKTTVMLKEAAIRSQKDKRDLKDALSDISHQMKTPLTSILVILDNLIDDPEMEPEVRQDFIRDVKREITHIQFLVQSLLKMTKLDAGTVVFFREEVELKEICREAMKNVSTLCDLRNVEMETKFAKEDKICCDLRWQTEAVTNILKNCAEQAPAGSKLILKTEKNPVYGAISITDFGPAIDPEEEKHLFERFYRGKNASAEGIGIGLSLAKTIVEQDSGKIFVESNEEKTTFTMKYF